MYNRGEIKPCMAITYFLVAIGNIVHCAFPSDSWSTKEQVKIMHYILLSECALSQGGLRRGFIYADGLCNERMHFDLGSIYTTSNLNTFRVQCKTFSFIQSGLFPHLTGSVVKFKSSLRRKWTRQHYINIDFVISRLFLYSGKIVPSPEYSCTKPGNCFQV